MKPLMEASVKGIVQNIYEEKKKNPEAEKNKWKKMQQMQKL